ncbi:hypothetical protein AA101099_2988 [Neoasaia chiangmaiensis NBRC 101099]|uniref:hypothetical protein n=1 Tax=Neoasaia chiangmaiensis TaxID=320497 RepID=UPI0011915745|nr:hypothetical protein [Neoasaia chiangmaiensis]GBR42791.1 hypothetical protein AA101099_2988 [Neoasaia chiangmaiensis NBRC 101099]GEN16191.1 hypothetical protein NCH01_26220 [Neoasaia chiangmaiensis]
MPFTFVFLIALVLVAILALFAPHARGLCMTMAEIYSFALIVTGTIDAIRNRRLD